jgi:hypothetical protein
MYYYRDAEGGAGCQEPAGYVQASQRSPLSVEVWSSTANKVGSASGTRGRGLLTARERVRGSAAAVGHPPNPFHLAEPCCFSHMQLDMHDPAPTGDRLERANSNF